MVLCHSSSICCPLTPPVLLPFPLSSFPSHFPSLSLFPSFLPPSYFNFPSPPYPSGSLPLFSISYFSVLSFPLSSVSFSFSLFPSRSQISIFSLLFFSVPILLPFLSLFLLSPSLPLPFPFPSPSLPPFPLIMWTYNVVYLIITYFILESCLPHAPHPHSFDPGVATVSSIVLGSVMHLVCLTLMMQAGMGHLLTWCSTRRRRGWGWGGGAVGTQEL